MLQFLLYIPDGVYSTTRQLFELLGNLPEEGIPTVVYIAADKFYVQRAVRAVPYTDHQSNLGGIPLLAWQSMT